MLLMGHSLDSSFRLPCIIIPSFSPPPTDLYLFLYFSSVFLPFPNTSHLICLFSSLSVHLFVLMCVYVCLCWYPFVRVCVSVMYVGVLVLWCEFGGQRTISSISPCLIQGLLLFTAADPRLASCQSSCPTPVSASI